MTMGVYGCGRAGGWLAVLMVSTALGGTALPCAAWAQAAPAGTEQARRHMFDIPAQLLADALPAFGRQAGIQVSAHGDVVRGARTDGVRGTMTEAQALGRLLAGTGLTWRLSGSTVILEKTAAEGVMTLDPVTVEGSALDTEETALGPVRGYVAKRSATGTKTDTPIIEVPQSISVVTADQIRAQGAQRIEQALAYTAGVVGGSYGSNPEQDYVFSRGFHIPLYVDGIRQYRDYVTGAQIGVEPYGLERVETLRGPSSGLYGQVAPGGMVNFVTKRPVADTLRVVEAQAGTFDRFQGAFDLGGRLESRGDVLFRLTGLVREAEGQMDFQEDNRVFIAPALTWQATDRTRLTLLTHFQKDTDALRPVPLPAQGTLYSSPNGKIPTDRFLGEPDFDSYSRKQYQIGYEFEHAFNDALAFRQKLQQTGVRQHEDFTLTMFDGSFLVDGRTVDRMAWDDRNTLNVFGIDNQVSAEIKTGPVAHSLLFGMDYRRATNDWWFAGASMSPIDAFNPHYGGQIGAFAVGIDRRQRENQTGLYVQDRIKFDQWILTLGGRHDWARSVTTDKLAGTAEKQDDQAFSGRVGLTYLFRNGLAPYASYSTSFEPELTVSSQGTPFKPTTGRQYEAGVKYQPPGQDGLLTAAVFDLTRQNVLTADPANPMTQIQTGEVRIRGLELEGKAGLAGGLDLTAAYTYFNSAITESNNGDVGSQLYFTPKHQLALWADYTVQDGSWAGFGFGGGMRYKGSVNGLYHEIRVPDHTLFDAALHYDLGTVDGRLANARLLVTARNVLDKEYISNCSFYEGCYYGDRRTVVASLRYQW